MEGLAAAGGVLAVASLALQVVEIVERIQDFWDRIKNAPAEIRSVLDDLALLSMVLRLIESNVTARRIHSQVLSLALNNCLCKVQVMERLLEQFQIGSTTPRNWRRRSWVTITAVRKDEKLARYRRSLEETKTTLMLALQVQTRMETK